MSIKKRITLLFQTPEEIGANLDRNDTHLTIKGDHNVVVQTRLQFDSSADENSTYERITWRNENADTPQNVISAYINTGLNYFTNNTSTIGLKGMPLISTPKYNILHVDNETEDIKLTDFLSKEQSSLINWDLESNQYDITKSNGVIEVTETFLLEANTSFIIDNNNKDKTNKDIDQEVGIFYVDSQDDVDINMSGLRCLWNGHPKIDRCLKTSLFFKPAFITYQDGVETPLFLEQPTGLHPKIFVDLTKHLEEPNCEYYLFTQLPLEIFVDKFQTSPVFVFGEHDLELPEYKLRDKAWGSETLYRLEPNEINEITLHSRYINITTEEPSYMNVSFNPVIFKACDKNSKDIAENPFYSKSLGVESFFTDDTNFHLLNNTKLITTIPRPGMKDYNNVQAITGITILFALVYLVIQMFPRGKKMEKTKRE